MVALAIASIALVSFITLVITSMDLEDHARKVTDATLAADDKLKEVERTGFPDVGKTEGLIDEQDPDGFSYVMVVTETSYRSGQANRYRGLLGKEETLGHAYHLYRKTIVLRIDQWDPMGPILKILPRFKESQSFYAFFIALLLLKALISLRNAGPAGGLGEKSLLLHQ